MQKGRACVLRNLYSLDTRAAELENLFPKTLQL